MGFKFCSVESGGKELVGEERREALEIAMAGLEMGAAGLFFGLLGWVLKWSVIGFGLFLLGKYLRLI